MTVSKVRIYDLAKELKLDTKRLIEEVRREGVDVSVPSNSVSKELAEKIRTKYFPKKEAAAKRVVKVVRRPHGRLAKRWKQPKQLRWLPSRARQFLKKKHPRLRPPFPQPNLLQLRESSRS
jgi:hypothetical protein